MVSISLRLLRANMLHEAENHPKNQTIGRQLHVVGAKMFSRAEHARRARDRDRRICSYRPGQISNLVDVPFVVRRKAWLISVLCPPPVFYPAILRNDKDQIIYYRVRRCPDCRDARHIRYRLLMEKQGNNARYRKLSDCSAKTIERNNNENTQKNQNCALIA